MSMEKGITHSFRQLINRDDIATPDLNSSQNRVVVFGSNLSGARILATDFQIYLEEMGIKNPSVEYLRNAALIEKVFYGIKDPRDQKNLPRGVITFPQMRQYDWSGRGMFISTYGNPGQRGPFPIDHIKELCDRHGIPLVRFDEATLETMIEEGLKAILPPELGLEN